MYLMVISVTVVVITQSILLLTNVDIIVINM